MNIDNIDLLRRAVSEKLGRRPASPRDFEILRCQMRNNNGDLVGMTTLKRFFGYVDNDHGFSVGTLSILARFSGYKDWDDFRMVTDLRLTSDSDFISTYEIRSSDLFKGDAIEASWLPDRCCLFRYLGNDIYKVERSANAKLKVGDTFKAISFAVGQPLYVSNLQTGDGQTYSYVAGKEHGLTQIKVIRVGDNA